MIFGSIKSFQHLRNPGLYSTENSENYWKLYYRFGGSFKPPKNPHPLLGWIGSFNRDTYDHYDMQKAAGKKPVLLYGDSFAQCVDTVQCFEDILNNDPSFSGTGHAMDNWTVYPSLSMLPRPAAGPDDHYLLNYGVGGYGVDQVYMLCSLTVKKFNDPLVVFSIMPTDMDRCILGVRTGQKPYFAEENGQLALKGIPIDSNPARFFEEHGPSITSYMYARFVHSDLNKFFHLGEGQASTRKKIIDLNKKIILKADSELSALHVRHVFMIFDNIFNEDGNWRTNFLISLFNEHSIPFIYTTELIDHDKDFSEYSFDHYIIPGEGHPTSHYNRLVAEEIKKFVFDFDNYSAEKIAAHKDLADTTSIAYFERRIRLDKSWLQSVKEKAEKRNIPLDSMIYLDALWLVEQERKKN